MTGPAGPLRVAVLQTAPLFGDIAGNVRDITGAATGADLVVTPELSLTGYDLRDAVHEHALPVTTGAPPPAALGSLGRAGDPALIAGFVERGDDAIPYNAALLVADGRVRHVHRKIYLPTYGVFDEGRWFGRGRSVGLVDMHGWRIAILICEDFWHPSLVYVAALAGADVLVVPAAAPGRGIPDGPGGPERFDSSVAWLELARVSARTHGIYVVLANRVGVEDGVTFAGGSRIVGPDAEILAAAGEEEPARIEAVLKPGELARARRPYAHLRDEDPRILIEALRTLGVGG
jgi:predicted amidohydrolase